MKLKSALAVALISLCATTIAHATLLTFNGLTTIYGDGSPLGAHMSATRDALSYTEQGYVLTLHTPDTYKFGAHIGDGTGLAQTYNWHDAGDNGDGAYVTLTARGGGLFNLIKFDYLSSGLTASALGYGPMFFQGSGAAVVDFMDVASVEFSSTDYTGNQLDNIKVTRAVPEPASLALLGLGLFGFAAVRRRSPN